MPFYDSQGNIVSGAANPASASSVLNAFFRNLNATLQTIKSGPGKVFSIQIVNSQAATDAVVQLFDALAGGVTLATTVPSMEIYIPAKTSLNITLPGGWNFSTGLCAASTTTEFGSSGSANGVVISAQYQ